MIAPMHRWYERMGERGALDASNRNGIEPAAPRLELHMLSQLASQLQALEGRLQHIEKGPSNAGLVDENKVKRKGKKKRKT